jgi:tetratricopeptide (TPR) repeat protein
LTLLLAVAFVPSVVVPPQRDLQRYLATAAHYASAAPSSSGRRTAALREIRMWSPSGLARATAALRREEGKLRSVVNSPDEIDFHTVEAAVLLHVEAGLLFLQDHRLPPAKVHLDTAVELRQWAHRAVADRRNWTAMRRFAFKDRPVDPGLELQESIDGRDFYVALATAALALGYSEAASPFAEQARLEAPLDSEVQLVLGCVASALAVEKGLQHEAADAVRARETAEKAFRESLALAPGTHEAQLRLAKLLLDENGTLEAEPLLAEVDAKATDDRQRYLARLFLGRAAERRGASEEAIRFYRRARDAWPDSQAARLGLAHALEQSSGPSAARDLVGALLDPSRPRDGPPDPWFLYPIGPPGVAPATYERIRDRTLNR